MGAIAYAQAVSAALEDVLAAAGFSQGQGGVRSEDGEEDRGDVQVLFCAAHDDLSDRFPRLPQADDQERGAGGCVDLMVNVSAAGLLAGVDLETCSLTETLAAVGLERERASVAAMAGHPIDEALPTIRAALVALFAT